MIKHTIPANQQETAAKRHTCPFHQRNPGEPYAGCTCGGSFAIRRKPISEVGGTGPMTEQEFQNALERNLSDLEERYCQFTSFHGEPMAVNIKRLAEHRGLTKEHEYLLLAVTAVESMQNTRAAYLDHMNTCISHRVYTGRFVGKPISEVEGAEPIQQEEGGE